MSITKIDDLYREFGAEKINDNIHVSLKHKFVYVSVAKTGSTTLKHVLQSHEMQELKPTWIKPHPRPVASPFVKPYQLTREQLASILFGQEYTIFTFVRHPLHRLYSAWRDKIAGNKPPKKQILKALGVDSDATETPVSFSEFIQAVSVISPQHHDKHWALQHRENFCPQIKYDFVGKLETLEKDLAQITKNLNLPLLQYLPETPKNSKHAGHQSISDAFGDAELALAKNIYKQDFALFDYQDGLA